MVFQVRTRRFYPRSERQADWLNAATILRLADIQTLGLYLLVNFLWLFSRSYCCFTYICVYL